MGLVAPRHVGSSWTRARTCVPCIGRRILNHCTTREALHLFIHHYVTIIDSCFIQWVINMLPSVFIFMLRLSQIWPIRAPSGWLLGPPDRSWSFFEHFLTFWCPTIFQVHLVLPCPSPGSSHFSKEPLVTFSSEWYLETKIWALGVLMALLCPGAVSA